MENISAIVIITVLLPYVFTVLFQGDEMSGSQSAGSAVIQEDRQETADRWVICGQNQKIPMERYIIGAVAASVPITYETEALKAQAVIIRTHICLLMKENHTTTEQEAGLAYIDLADMQAAWGYEDFTGNYDKLCTAVHTTENQVILYEGDLIYPPFHAVSAGRTRNGNEIAGKTVYPYLQPVDSSMDLTSEEYLKITYYSREDFLHILRQTYEEVTLNQPEIASELEIQRETDSHYVKELIFKDTETRITGEEMRELFHLNSPCFYIEDYEGEIRIVTKGLGHGIGLSAYGANQMAKQGSSFETILQYYYPGTMIEQICE